MKEGRRCLPRKIIVAVLSVQIITIVCVQFLVGSTTGIIGTREAAERKMGTTPQGNSIQQQRQRSKNVFVCITGQVQRLELHNKIRTILLPLREAGFEPFIALMLTDDDTPRYTNRGNKYGQLFNNFSHVVDSLKARGFDNIATTTTTAGPIVQPVEPMINQAYAEHMKRKLETHHIRMLNHARQFHTLTKCGEEMARGNRDYEFVIRLREDVSMTDPMRVDDLYEQLISASASASSRKIILSSDCRSHKGMNDRLAIVSREASYQYFHAPFIHWYLYATNSLQLDLDGVKNPETYLRKTYERSGLTVIDSKLLRFVVKLEPTKDGSFVLFYDEHLTYCPNHDLCLPAHIWKEPQPLVKPRQSSYHCAVTYLLDYFSE